MSARLRSILFVVTALVCRGSFAEAPPAAPDGFTWTTCKAMKGVFLLPNGWNFREEQNGDTSACFITKEKITASAGFDTGISINLVKDLPRKAKLKPSDYAQRYLAAVEGKYQAIKKVSSSKGPFEHYGIEFISTNGSNPPIHMWHILIANDRTGSLHMIVAESPNELWPQNWPVLETVVSMLGVDDTV
jgi:hypothetical protein